MKSVGDLAEDATAQYLKKQFKWKVLARNWRSKDAEIDIVAQEGSRRSGVIHFIEVKYRSRSMDDAFSSVTNKKALKLARGSQQWLQEQDCSMPHQIDIAVVLGGADGALNIELRENVIQDF